MKTIYKVCTLAYELWGEDDSLEISEKFLGDEDLFTSEDVEKAKDYFFYIGLKNIVKEPLKWITPEDSDFYTVYLRLEKCIVNDNGDTSANDILEEESADWFWDYIESKWI